MKTLAEMINLGSNTAKSGFKNEKEIADKFNNWIQDIEAQQWLSIMQYDLDEINFVKAVIISGHKADINVQITVKSKQIVDVQNLQVKLVSNKKGFNQIDKRWIKNYVDMWNIPNSTVELLRLFTGEIPPKIVGTRDARRMFVDEFSKNEQNKLLSFFDANKVMILSDILKGRGKFSAEWVLVAQKILTNARWTLKPINQVINHYFGDGLVEISPKGSIRIGKVTIQRKGGDNGRSTANMLQFKIDPTDLFGI
ncbi:MAG: type II restriction endonuclease [Firmicutes bacterium]|nr:type II restriction endonuclease [Bacillota bacterium]MCL1953915.1 type II restriction endonuclease [Bacillota bacterium]